MIFFARNLLLNIIKRARTKVLAGRINFATMSSSFNVYITRRIPHTALKLLEDRYNVSVWDSDDPIPRDILLENIQGIDALYCLLTDKIDEEVLTVAGPNLKIIGTMSVGYSHIDVKACKKRAILVGYTPDVLTDATAELGIALLLACSRRLFEAAQEVRSGGWSTWSPLWMCGTNLAGSTVGFVGLGRIGFIRNVHSHIYVEKYISLFFNLVLINIYGQAMLSRLKEFKVARFVYTCPKLKSTEESFGAEYLTLSNLLECSDFVIVCCALNQKTEKLFNYNTFALMKSNAIFLNISRGEIVDQEALYDALLNNKIKAAGLDVTTPEPLPVNHPLLTLSNCVILPHIGSATEATRFRMAELTSENIIAALEKKPMPAKIKL